VAGASEEDSVFVAVDGGGKGVIIEFLAEGRGDVVPGGAVGAGEKVRGEGEPVGGVGAFFRGDVDFEAGLGEHFEGVEDFGHEDAGGVGAFEEGGVGGGDGDDGAAGERHCGLPDGCFLVKGVGASVRGGLCNGLSDENEEDLTMDYILGPALETVVWAA